MPSPARRGRREGTVRLVDYVSFPRVRSDQRWRVGFTLASSPEGMTLRADTPVAAGSLLRVVVRGIDGRPTLDSVAQVATCGEDGAGRFRLGLVLVATRGGDRPARPLPRAA